MKLSIVIPAYNESKTIVEILDKIKSVELIENLDKEIVVIDDFSKDNTLQIVSKYIDDNVDVDIVLLKHKRNRGKGAAIRTGLSSINGDIVIIQDADLEYDPNDYNKLLTPILRKETKVIYGSRFLDKTNKHSYTRFYLGGRLLSWITNVLFNQRLTDEPTCYKMFDVELFKSINLKCEGFEFCPEITAKVAKKGIRIPEVPINYYPRSIEEGKKIRWYDGIEAIWTLMKYRIVN